MQKQFITIPNFSEPAPAAQVSATAVLVLATLGARAKMLGRAPMLTSDRTINGWTFRRWDEDSSWLPPVAWKQIVAINGVGVKPLGYVILHEPEPRPADKLGPAKEELASGWSKAKERMVAFGTAAAPVARTTAEKTKALVVASAPVALAVGKGLVKAAGITALAVGALILGVLGIVANILIADPVLIAVVPADDGGDPVWIEIARWYEGE